MAAILVNVDGNDIFKRKAGNASHLIKVPSVDDVIGKSGLAIYTDVTLQLGETIQYFLTFDDVIKFIHFGKGVGNVVANGILFSNCDSDIVGLPKLLQAIRALRGQETKILIGSETFTSILTNASINITGEPDTMANFQVVFSVVNHNL
jgi:hypothetical protein